MSYLGDRVDPAHYSIKRWLREQSISTVRTCSPLRSDVYMQALSEPLRSASAIEGLTDYRQSSTTNRAPV
jgi:hypothetical protein